MSLKITEAMTEAIYSKLEELKKKSFSELELLPEYSDRTIKTNKGKEIVLALWLDKDKNGNIQIVVQAYHKGILGCGIMIADGFLVDSSDRILNLPEEKRLEYC